jgi:bifunctional enzyme CysN/CysC
MYAQGQGVCIDAARNYFATARRGYQIIDAPGHVEFLKNMVTGASRAEAALLVIDGGEGVRDNSRRHAYLLSLLGIEQVAVVVSKMDLLGWDRQAFDRIESEYRAFLAQVGIRPACCIPVSAVTGENVSRRVPGPGWYDGPTVVEALDLFRTSVPTVDGPLRMPVQGVYKFTKLDDQRRIVAGTIESGTVRVGDELMFFPSGKASRVRSLEAFNAPPRAEARAGEAIGFTLSEQIFVTRGEVATRAGEEPPAVGTRLRVSLFWLGAQPFRTGRDYTLALGTARVPARLEQIHEVIEATDLCARTGVESVARHQIGHCTLALARPLAFDVGRALFATSRFVIFDGRTIGGGGTVRALEPDQQASLRRKVLERNYKWQAGGVSEDRRAERYAQRPGLVIVSGDDGSSRKRLARELEAGLFDEGRHVYLLGIGNVLYGVDSDIERTQDARPEHVRRLAEVANILLDAGLIVVGTAAALSGEDLQIIRTSVGADRLVAIWLGDPPPDGTWDAVLPANVPGARLVERAGELLRERGLAGPS